MQNEQSETTDLKSQKVKSCITGMLKYVTYKYAGVFASKKRVIVLQILLSILNSSTNIAHMKRPHPLATDPPV